MTNELGAFLHQWNENAKKELATGCLSFETFAMLQWVWSKRTFGPIHVRGPIGPLKHLEKEVKEAIEKAEELIASRTKTGAQIGTDFGTLGSRVLEEYADLLFLVFDAVWRSGFTLTEFKQAITAKYNKNTKRDWGNWQEKDPDAPIEHNRDGEKPE